jgi:hypothetical protein
MKFSEKRCTTLEEIRSAEAEANLGRSDLFIPSAFVPECVTVKTGLECMVLGKESFDSCRKE